MEDNKKGSSKEGEYIYKNFSCRSCGMKFDNFGDMQKHITVEHHQKGDVP